MQQWRLDHHTPQLPFFAPLEGSGGGEGINMALIILWSCAFGHLVVGKQVFPTADGDLYPTPCVDSEVHIHDIRTKGAHVPLLTDPWGHGTHSPPTYCSRQGQGTSCTRKATGLPSQDLSPTLIDSRLSNNMGWNCVGPCMDRFFSVNTCTVCNPRLGVCRC